jgi:GTP-dependent phosphoenolpyruvate carboxykinase
MLAAPRNKNNFVVWASLHRLVLSVKTPVEKISHETDAASDAASAVGRHNHSMISPDGSAIH